MTQRQSYSFVILRYVHDVTTAEFINIGVLVAAKDAGVRFSLRTSIKRIKAVFPDFDRVAFSRAMAAVKRGLEGAVQLSRGDLLSAPSQDAASVARSILPPDDSSLQWSTTGGGISNDIDATLADLFDRFVARYDHAYKSRRTDNDVWRPVRKKLAERNLASVLTEKTFVGAIDQIEFKHAWKNGQWHVYEPVSFDMADADGIKSKAREWLGHLTAVAQGEDEPFKPHFIVGRPSDDSLQPAFQSAVEILKTAPFQPQIFAEHEIDALVDQIEDEVVHHRVSQ
jgi:hypothetical protein